MKIAITAPTIAVKIAIIPPPMLVTKPATAGKISNIINAVMITPKLMIEIIPPRSETISPDIERPLTVFDFIKSKMNMPVPMMDNKNEGTRNIIKNLKIGVGAAQTQHRQETKPHKSDIMFINGCLNLMFIG